MSLGDPSWIPDPDTVAAANLSWLLAEGDLADVAAAHRWSVADRAAFWSLVVERLGIVFRRPPDAIMEGDAEYARWLPGARLNIVDSCFTAPGDRTAIVFRRRSTLHRVSYADLRLLVNRFAHGYVRAGFGVGDRVAIAMPMTMEAIVAYLGIIAAGGVVVGIADSFASHEIATRLALTDPVAVVTQDRMIRLGRDLPMFDKVVDAGASLCIVVGTHGDVELRPDDRRWEDFLGGDEPFETVATPPGAHTNILFSSGTTGSPKAIPWTQTTPIKAAMDGHFHQDIHPEDTVVWPTNLGWMMGPWLIYAALIGDATIALYDDGPGDAGFTSFVADSGATVVGLVPSIVAAWRAAGALDGVDWTSVRVLSSTGEASNPEDYDWLMRRAGGKPMIEYCGGTEIGGAYISGTVLQPAVAGTFTTPTLGIDLRVLDGEGRIADVGEVLLVPPCIGLSIELLNRDHHAVYYSDLPESDVPLRRHGDHMERLDGGRYRALGRVDDTMNLSGIKVSSAEIERVTSAANGVVETAAVAVAPPGGGPSRLIVYAVPEQEAVADPDRLRAEMQAAIRSELNPLFKIHEVVLLAELPRTASAKVMRRELREGYPR